MWETLEKIEEEKELREAKREKSKTKKFNQQVKSNARKALNNLFKTNVLQRLSPRFTNGGAE